MISDMNNNGQQYGAYYYDSSRKGIIGIDNNNGQQYGAYYYDSSRKGIIGIDNNNGGIGMITSTSSSVPKTVIVPKNHQEAELCSKAESSTTSSSKLHPFLLPHPLRFLEAHHVITTKSSMHSKRNYTSCATDDTTTTTDDSVSITSSSNKNSRRSSIDVSVTSFNTGNSCNRMIPGPTALPSNVQVRGASSITPRPPDGLGKNRHNQAESDYSESSRC